MHREELNQPASPATAGHEPGGEKIDLAKAVYANSVSKSITRISKRIPASALLAIAGLLSLAVCLVIVPAAIKSSTNGHLAEQRAREWLKQTIHDDLSQDAQQELAELYSSTHAHPGKAHAADAAKAAAESALFNEDLRMGRWLVSKGKLEKAIPYYEAYLRLDPDSIKARLELINVSIATKQSHKARLLCITTLKKHLSSNEIGAVWQLLSQCQTD